MCDTAETSWCDMRSPWLSPPKQAMSSFSLQLFNLSYRHAIGWSGVSCRKLGSSLTPTERAINHRKANYNIAMAGMAEMCSNGRILYIVIP